MASLPNKLKLLCWEGYEASEITQPFEARYDTTLDVDTLLSDAIAADNICSNKSSRPDLININNAYIRDYLHQQDLIFTLDQCCPTNLRVFLVSVISSKKSAKILTTAPVPTQK